MIKKLLFLGTTLLFFNSVSNAQAPSNIPYHDLRISKAPATQIQNSVPAAKTESISVMSDTLTYFDNKFHYRNPSATPYPWLLSPMTGTVNFTHWGSIFLNPGTVSVSGLQCMVARHPSSPSPSVNVRMYLCTMTQGNPNFPPLDSLMGVASSTQFITNVAQTFSVPHVVNGDFAVFFRCIPTVAGDSLKLIRTDGRTFTNTAVASSQRYGEGLGAIRYQGNIYSTTNLYGSGSPSGTDFEFMVAPIVSYTAATNQVSNNFPALCTGTNYAFNNLSTQFLKHRQYNLNEFYRKWRPLVNAVDVIDADSVFTWNFGDGSPDRYTPSGTSSISVTYSTVGSYSISLTSKFQKMSRSGVKLQDVAYAVKTTSNCSVDTYVGELSGFESVKIYPNPAVGGKTTISGLSGNNTVSVCNVLGQMITRLTSDKEIVSIDLLNQPSGSYILKITNTSNNATKVIKIVNDN